MNLITIVFSLTGIMPKTVLLIFNSKSGFFLRNKNIPKELEKICRQENISPIWINPFEVKDWHGVFTKHTFQEIWVCGGDGTLFYLLPHLQQTSARVVLLPSGSGNGLANALHISSNIKKAYLYHRTTKSKSIYLVQSQQHQVFSAVSMGFGLDAAICAYFNTSAQRGLWAYVFSSIQVALKKQSWHFTISIDKDRVFDNEAVLVVLANQKFYGNTFIAAPEADVFSDRFQLLIFPKMSIWKLAFVFAIFQLRVKQLSRFVCKIFGVKNYLTSSALVVNTQLAPFQVDGENLVAVKQNTFCTAKTHFTIATPRP